MFSNITRIIILVKELEADTNERAEKLMIQAILYSLSALRALVSERE